MRCVARGAMCSFLNVWLVIYALGFVWHDRALVFVPAMFAAFAALGMQRWSAPLVDYTFTGAARTLHALIVGTVFSASILGLAGAATGFASTFETEGSHLRDSPLAVFFLITAVLAWRALVTPSPRRVIAIAVFVYVAWLPFTLWNVVQSLGDSPGTDWQQTATQGALWALLAGGGVVCWLATLTTPRTVDLPVARRV
ncbi:MAG: hypothetical protein ABI867_32985 [Kofleriaceae bacterium]